MNRGLDPKETEHLYRAVLTLKTLEDCEDFFENLCTIPELKAMAQRVEVAKMLSDGCVYRDIVEATGASTATISRVNRELLYGKKGYIHAFERLSEK